MIALRAMLNRCLEIAGSLVCHQTPERSFLVDHHPLPLCARCTGIYLGVFVGACLGFSRGFGFVARHPPVRSRHVVLVCLGVAALLTHALAEHWGLRSSSNSERAAVGALGGLPMGWALLSLCRPPAPAGRLPVRTWPDSRLLTVCGLAALLAVYLGFPRELLSALVWVSLFATYFLLNSALAITLLAHMPNVEHTRGWLPTILTTLLLWCVEWVALGWLQ